MRCTRVGFGFTKDFFVECIKSDFGITMFYMLVIISIQQLTSFLWLPVNLFFMIGACNFFRESKIGLFNRESIQNFSRGVSQNATDIKKGRVYCEFFMIFYFIIMTILGYYTWII